MEWILIVEDDLAMWAAISPISRNGSILALLTVIELSRTTEYKR